VMTGVDVLMVLVLLDNTVERDMQEPSHGGRGSNKLYSCNPELNTIIISIKSHPIHTGVEVEFDVLSNNDFDANSNSIKTLRNRS